MSFYICDILGHYGLCCSLFWFEWIWMTETWTREHSCAQLPLLPKLLCPLLSPLGCAFQRLVIHTAVTVHILELFPLPASLALSLCSQTPICLDTDHNTQALGLIIWLSLVPLLHCCTFKVCFLHCTLSPWL